MNMTCGPSFMLLYTSFNGLNIHNKTMGQDSE